MPQKITEYAIVDEDNNLLFDVSEDVTEEQDGSQFVTKRIDKATLVELVNKRFKPTQVDSYELNNFGGNYVGSVDNLKTGAVNITQAEDSIGTQLIILHDGNNWDLDYDGNVLQIGDIVAGQTNRISVVLTHIDQIDVVIVQPVVMLSVLYAVWQELNDVTDQGDGTMKLINGNYPDVEQWFKGGIASMAFNGANAITFELQDLADLIAIGAEGAQGVNVFDSVENDGFPEVDVWFDLFTNPDPTRVLLFESGVYNDPSPTPDPVVELGAYRMETYDETATTAKIRLVKNGSVVISSDIVLDFPISVLGFCNGEYDDSTIHNARFENPDNLIASPLI